MSGIRSTSFQQLALSFAVAFLAAFLVARLTADAFTDQLLWFGASLAAAIGASGVALVVLRQNARSRH